jgi:hypothetical protein
MITPPVARPAKRKSFLRQYRLVLVLLAVAIVLAALSFWVPDRRWQVGLAAANVLVTFSGVVWLARDAMRRRRSGEFRA